MKRFVLSVITASMTAILVFMPSVHAVARYQHYVAMGDSIAAGAGLPALPAATNEDVICGRSGQAYPYKLAALLGTGVTQLSCTGAKVNDGIYGDQERGGAVITPQLNQAFTNGTPDLITMTVGANDARWAQFIWQCYVTTCGTSFDDSRAQIYRADLRVELFWALYRINQFSGAHPPTIALTGYYSAFNDTSCSGFENVTIAEQKWLNARTADLNQAIFSVTQWFPNARYVPVSFEGHELCTNRPWIQGVNDPAPFHPTDRGQTALANEIFQSLR